MLRLVLVIENKPSVCCSRESFGCGGVTVVVSKLT